MGEIAYNQAEMTEARAWISTHPARFVQLCFERAGLYWFYSDVVDLKSVQLGLAFAKAALGWMFTALGLVGVWYLYRKDRVAFAVVVTALIVVPLPDYLVHVGLRHRYTIDWLLVLLSAFTVWNLWAGITGIKRRSGSLTSSTRSNASASLVESCVTKRERLPLAADVFLNAPPPLT